MELRLTATECHLLYGITQCYLYPTQVNTPRLNPSQTGRIYSIYLPLPPLLTRATRIAGSAGPVVTPLS